jgi:hypothetical protein
MLLVIVSKKSKECGTCHLHICHDVVHSTLSKSLLQKNITLTGRREGYSLCLAAEHLKQSPRGN